MVKASVLYAEDAQVQALPALRKAASSTAERETLNLTVQGSIPLPAYFMRRWRHGKRARLLTGRSGFDSSVTRSRSVGGKRTTRLPLKQETAGSNPARSTRGPIVYGLGSGVFTPGNRVRLPVGSLRGGAAR